MQMCNYCDRWNKSTAKVCRHCGGRRLHEAPIPRLIRERCEQVRRTWTPADRHQRLGKPRVGVELLEIATQDLLDVFDMLEQSVRID